MLHLTYLCDVCVYVKYIKLYKIRFNLLLSDYVVQGARYEIVEDIGCIAMENISGLSLLLIDIWPVFLPAISALFYCREYTNHRFVSLLPCVHV